MKKSVFFSTFEPRYLADLEKGLTTASLLEKSIEYAANDGFQGIELFPTKTMFEEGWEDEAKRLREALDKNNITCPTFSHGLLSIVKNPDEALFALKRCIDVAEILGSSNFHHTIEMIAYHDKVKIYQEVEPTCVKICKEAAEYAGEKGIWCIYEDQGFLFNTVDRLGTFLNKINCKNTGICLDVGNSLWHEVNPIEYVAAFPSLIRHVHLKDYIYKSKYMGSASRMTFSGNYVVGVPIGYGIVDFEAIFTMLLKANYDGFYSLEGISYPDLDEGLKINLENIDYNYKLAKLNVEAFKNF